MRNQRLTAQLENFEHQIQKARHRLAALPDSITAAELLQELEASLEELRVAEEELAQQEEALEMAELSVKLAHAHYRELFEFAPLGYIVTDLNGVIIEANRTAIELLNVKPQYIIGKPFVIYAAEDDKYYLRSRLLGLQHSYDIQSWEMHLQPRHRASVPVAVTCVRAQLDESDSLSSVVRWLVYDLTARKQIEEAERERVFRSTFEQAAVGMAYLTPAGRWLRVNQRWIEMIGYSREELLELNYRDITHPDDVQPSQRAHQQLINLETEQVTVEKRYRRKDGSDLWANVTASLVFGGDEKPLYIVSVIEDISARKAAEEAERQQRLLAETLHDTAIQLTSTLNMNEVLNTVLVSLKRVIPHDAIIVVLTKGATAQIVRTQGLAEIGLANLQDTLENIHLLVDDVDVLRYMAQTRESVYFPAWTERGDLQSRFPHLESFDSFIASPILFQNQALGFILLFSQKTGFFSEQHTRILLAFAAQAAIAIQNALLLQQARELAVLEDRQRLARDLHDAVSQTLFSSVLITETLPQVLQRSQADALEYLRDLEALNRSAMAEMRVLLLELRPEQLMRMKLQDQIVHLTEAAKGRKAIDFALNLEQGLDLPPSVRISFFRITQEALNNIIKHSYATQVNIHLMQKSGLVELCIQDNGHGFQPETIKAGMGMSTMRERAQEINARLRIHSGVGEGTIILVTWKPPGG
jgi:PAS domain S-box-containing protein